MNGEKRSLLPWAFLGLGLGAFALLAWIFWSGRSYYLAPLSERPLQGEHARLRPSGSLGLLLGIAATGCILLNLSYLLRKRWSPLRRAGTLRSWMGLHVATGLLAGGGVLLHSAFVPRSALGAVALTTIVVVIAAGLVGRYIYALVPRSLEGHELEHEEARRRLTARVQSLRGMGLDLRLAELPARESRARAGIPALLVGVILGDVKARREYRRLRRRVLSDPAGLQARAVLPLLAKIVKERTWLHRYHELQRLMRSWRFLHLWLALLLVLAVACHIGVALYFGDLQWPGGSP